MVNHTASAHSVSFSWRRLFALIRKETYQITRDPSSSLIAFLIPIMLLFIFGYGINLDSSKIRVGILLEQQNTETRQFVDTFIGSSFIEPTISRNRQELVDMLQAGKIRGLVVIPSDFTEKLYSNSDIAPIQVITDGSEPNTANFVWGFTQGAWQIWQQNRAQEQGTQLVQPIELDLRYWFNPAAVSRNFIIPGAITIIMTVIGTILTSLVIAREWERGTMEALLSTQVTRAELLISKIVPYYFLGMAAMLLCMVVSIFIMDVPYRGSLWVLFGISSLYLCATLGMGLLISTLTRNQFNAAMVALNLGFLPAVMLSGFVFEINSMPAIIQVVTYIIPARYFVNALQTLFLAGNIAPILLINFAFLIAAACLFIGLTALKTRRRLD